MGCFPPLDDDPKPVLYVLVCFGFLVPAVPLELYLPAWEGWSSFDLYFPQEKNSRQDSSASLLRMQKKRNIKKPWKELKITKRIWKASLTPVTEKVRMAKSQVSPNRNITPLMLIIKRMIVFLLTDSFIRAAVPLVWRTRTTITQMKMTTLNSITAMTGPRKAPQKAPGWDRKQLHIYIVKKKVSLSDDSKSWILLYIYALAYFLNSERPTYRYFLGYASGKKGNTCGIVLTRKYQFLFERWCHLAQHVQLPCQQ